jgi:hypothetical protein
MSNDITNLTPQILANILEVLRENCVMPMLVNNNYSADAASQGSTIDINDLNDMEAFDITPALLLCPGLFPMLTLLRSNWFLINFRLLPLS